MKQNVPNTLQEIDLGFGIFQSIWRVVTGKVIHRADTVLENGTTVSIRLKQDDDLFYVVMAMTSAGKYFYYPMDMTEFQQVLNSMIQTKAAIESNQGKH